MVQAFASVFGAVLCPGRLLDISSGKYQSRVVLSGMWLLNFKFKLIKIILS